jgi:hypothetical protein
VPVHGSCFISPGPGTYTFRKYIEGSFRSIVQQLQLCNSRSLSSPSPRSLLRSSRPPPVRTPASPNDVIYIDKLMSHLLTMLPVGCGFEHNCPCHYNIEKGCVPTFDECAGQWYWPPSCTGCAPCLELCFDPRESLKKPSFRTNDADSWGKSFARLTPQVERAPTLFFGNLDYEYGSGSSPYILLVHFQIMGNVLWVYYGNVFQPFFHSYSQDEGCVESSQFGAQARTCCNV